MVSKITKNRKVYNKCKELIIVYLSDSKASQTNIPLRLNKIISKEYLDNRIIFKELNIYNLIHIIFIIIKSSLDNKVTLIHSHHLKSLIINILLKLISNIFGFKLITFHSFLCELKRFTNIKLMIFKISKIFVDEYICVSNELKYSWGSFLKKNIHFIKIGISKKDRDLIQLKSIKQNKLKSNLKLNDKCFDVTLVGRLEKVKRPLFIFDILDKISLKNNQKINIYFAGNGILRENLIEKINEFNDFKRKNSNINIEYLGFINRIQLLDLISNTNLYINTSYSEGCLVTAMEFMSNPFCEVILPRIKSIKDIYKCKRSSFYPIHDKNYLLHLFQDKLEKFYDNSKIKSSFIYPINFEDFILENSSKILMDLYLSSALKLKS